MNISCGDVVGPLQKAVLSSYSGMLQMVPIDIVMQVDRWSSACVNVLVSPTTPAA